MVKPTTQAPLEERVGGDEGRERSVKMVVVSESGCWGRVLTSNAVM